MWPTMVSCAMSMTTTSSAPMTVTKAVAPSGVKLALAWGLPNSIRGEAEPTVRREVEVSRELSGLHLSGNLAGGEIDHRQQVVPGRVDPGRLAVWCQHQAMGRAFALGRDRAGDADRPRIDGNRL